MISDLRRQRRRFGVVCCPFLYFKSKLDGTVSFLLRKDYRPEESVDKEEGSAIFFYLIFD